MFFLLMNDKYIHVSRTLFIINRTLLHVHMDANASIVTLFFIVIFLCVIGPYR